MPVPDTAINPVSADQVSNVAAGAVSAGGHDLSIFGLFLHADFVVKFVMLVLIAMQIRRMAHRTPIFTYAMLGCVAGGPTLFLVANIFWLLAAFRPERSPELTQMFNDLAWITFTSQVPFLIAQSVLLALAIYFDDPHRPVLPRWVAYFNLVVAAALVPAAFVALTLSGPVAWDGVLSFWLKNIAIAASLAKLFRGGELTPNFSARDLWNHSTAVATQNGR